MSAITQSLRESKTARWSALAIVSFTMLTGYYINYVISPLKPMLEQYMGWDSGDFGFWNSAYGWFNVFFLMLIFGGIILDKIGVRFTGLGAAITMIIGTGLQYIAIEGVFPMEGMIFGVKKQIAIGALGFGIFGVGVEIAGITVSKIIVKWFKGKELALAMGLEMATARMGTALALALPLPMAKALGTGGIPNISAPVMLGLALLVAGLIAFIWYTFMDKKLEASEGISDEINEEDAFKVSDIFVIISNKGFWLLALLCVLFYSGIFPFLYYATDLMINKYAVGEDFAGAIPSLLPFGTILLTPLFGSIYDRKGKGATIMLIGSIMLLCVHALFTIPVLNHYIIAVALIILLGVTFSLVPSAMWPSVPKIIPEKQLGTAYALIFWVQNWGLMGMPLLIGLVLEKYCITSQEVVDGVSKISYDYTLPMAIFAATGLLAIGIALLLKAEDKKKGYGLELPNIQK
ncbi:MFS transporter [Marinifilum caeruleilacunae]|uniref:Lysosomal dipeptide transporter MFSD1 n=1 Tax=Marinifilum caeruleilacunae TaxID=2499076 RepID=A0ABX1WTE3_9BACT|nr:MFS transporter [Marinifilum caeruleilacunae]NOU59367.1 MFS transporter [Marinifilum caeruleilacunae]